MNIANETSKQISSACRNSESFKLDALTCLIVILVATLCSLAANAQDDLPPVNEHVKIQDVITNGFIHPGIGITKEMLINARKKVIEKQEPWLSGYQALASSQYSSKNVKCRNQSTTNPSKPEMDAFDTRGVNNRLKEDASKAKQQALMYFFTGDQVYRANAMNIVRVWSQMDPSKYVRWSEAYIHSSWPIKDMVQAAELLRYTSTDDPKLKWTDADTKNFIENFALPASNTFLNENGWFMNQNGYPLAAAMSVDIFMSDRQRYERRVEWFTVNKTAPNKGWSSSITHLARLVEKNEITGEKVDNPIVQLMEMGRDQAHAGDDVDIFVVTASLMNAQRTKVDPTTGEISSKPDALGPYEFLNDRILAASDLFCRFMLGYDTPWIPAAYDIGPNGETRGIYPRIADNYRGRIRGFDFWDMYYYYTFEKGVDLAKKAPYYNEAFSKRIVNSVTDWISIPASATGEGARVPTRDQEPSMIKIAQRSTPLSPDASIIREGDSEFVRVRPSKTGTRLAVLSADTAKKMIALRLRTTGTAEVAMSGFKKPLFIPNTQGTWRTITYTMINLERFRDIVYFTVVGDPRTQIDFDLLHRMLDEKFTPLVFQSGSDDLQMTAYAGAPVEIDFATNLKTDIVVSSLDQPANSELDKITGTFKWRASKAGAYSFTVNATSGDLIAAKRVKLHIAPDRVSAIRQIMSQINLNLPYVKSTMSKYLAVVEDVKKLEGSSSDQAFFKKLLELQQAVNELQLLSPKLADGSLDYPLLVAKSNIGESIGLLTDGNDDSFPVYTLAKDLKYIFDFGESYQISASAFALEGRLNFENRTQDTAFFGSNDAKSWIQLTAPLKTLPTELTRIDVNPDHSKERFRYLKIEKTSDKSAPLFEPAELRIFGERYESK